MYNIKIGLRADQIGGDDDCMGRKIFMIMMTTTYVMPINKER